MTHFEELQSSFPEIDFKQSFPLAPITYFKIGGLAEIFAKILDIDHLQKLMGFCKTSSIPITIIGGCSNIIISDEGIPGLTLQLAYTDISFPKNKDYTVEAGAGIKTALLVRSTVDNGFEGLEYFLGVPGQLGGAIYNNAHYMQDLIGEHVHSVQILTTDGELRWITQKECAFGYDTSRFHTTDEIIVSVRFTLQKGDTQASLQKIAEATEYRAKTQPLGKPSSGCIFKNAPNTPELKQKFPQFADRAFIPAGFLIDQAGLKQLSEGDISISDKHAAFMINNGNGTASDVASLVKKVKKEVQSAFGVHLQEEVFYLPRKQS